MLQELQTHSLLPSLGPVLFSQCTSAFPLHPGSKKKKHFIPKHVGSLNHISIHVCIVVLNKSINKCAAHDDTAQIRF